MIENEVLSAAVLCDARLGWWLDIDTIALVDARTRPPVGGGDTRGTDSDDTFGTITTTKTASLGVCTCPAWDTIFFSCS
jgi:hypothetical protein